MDEVHHQTVGTEDPIGEVPRRTAEQQPDPDRDGVARRRAREPDEDRHEQDANDDDRERETGTEREGNSRIEGQRERQRSGEVLRPVRQAIQRDRLRGLIQADNDGRCHRDGPHATAGRHPTSRVSPRCQRRDSPPLLQAMHSRVYGSASRRSFGINSPHPSHTPYFPLAILVSAALISSTASRA